MKPSYLVRAVSLSLARAAPLALLILSSAALTAQVARQENAVPLKNWSTPLYWQPNQVEREAAGQALHQGAAPQLMFSANAVSTSALTFIAITPCRLVDTRGAAAGFNGIAPFSGPPIASKGTLTIPVQSPTEATDNTTPAPCGAIPSIAQAYSFNLTVVPVAGGAVDYVSMWPAGSTQPVVATLDDPQGAIVSNAAIVPAGPIAGYGGVSVYNDGPATMDVIIDMNGFFAAPSDSNGNTAIGQGALQLNTTGSFNTASGGGALNGNTTGSDNTATGTGALGSNATSSDNTASGAFALTSNINGDENTATGSRALQSNTTGDNNMAGGYQALQNNLSGCCNTASGDAALQNNTNGNLNTASGYHALQSGNGSYNTATGAIALTLNTTGSDNTADGLGAMENNTAGSNNTAEGTGALSSNTTGTSNIAVGYQAATNVSGGNSNNIHIGSQGASGDSGVIRIGTEGTQTSAYIAGISGASAPGGAAVYVTSNGQLGTALSSRRFKEQITDMGDSSSKLFQLRPVNFFYKPQYDDGSHLLQYGLIAEEVAKVYPEMVAYDNDGQILTVKYQLLAPMLLNEVQRQNTLIEKQAEVNQLQQEQNRILESRLAALEAWLSSQSAAARPANGQ